MTLTKEKIINFIFVLMVLVFLNYTSGKNYLLFHAIAEIFSICIAFTIYLLTWNSKQFLRNNFLIIMGVAYLFIGFLDLLHTLSYKGMNIFRDYDYYANQLWIATRFLESITIFVSFLLLNFKKQINTYLIFFVYLITTVIIISSIFYLKVFPICYIDGVGLTQFKIVSEYIISLILLASLGIAYYYRKHFDKLIYKLIFTSIVFTILSELSFTLYTSNYDFLNMMGHYFKIISFYFIYKAIIVKGIKEPNYSIFKELQSQVNTDGLTGLYNYKYLYEKLDEEIRHSLRKKLPFSIIIFDVDHFKIINDLYGHVKGDEALQGIACYIKELTRVTDTVGRYGGEEFMVILPNTVLKDCYAISEKIRCKIREVDHINNGARITISAGIAEFDGNYIDDVSLTVSNLASRLVDVADNNLYNAKASGRDKTMGYQ